MTEESKLRSRFRAERFYEELARLLNRYNPRDYGPHIASMIVNLVDKPRKWRYYPLHFLVHSIEVNCTYHKPYRNYPITSKRINEIMNHYKGYYDPYFQHTLEDLGDLELWALAMARQQFPLQAFPRPVELARCLRLFVEGSPLPSCADQFRRRYGFDMRDWVFLAFALCASSIARRKALISASDFLDSEIASIPRSAVQPFLQMSSLSPGQVADRYRALRQPFPAYLHVFVPSVFMEHPLIDYEDGTYLVVHPTLVFRQATDGLYRVCKELDGDVFHEEFANSFEKYVGTIAGELSDVVRVWTESEIQAVSPGRTCDYVVEHSCF
ncbi:hypothetical protein ACFLWA_11705 [Chloroflexota bacterium]